MNFRIWTAKKLIRLGAFIQSLAVPVMKPKDLIRFGQLSYNRKDRIKEWSSDHLLDRGMSPEEEELIRSIPLQKGKALVLGVGGGREALKLAGSGFEVSGVDFIPEMVENAVANLKDRGYTMTGLVQDISNLTLPGKTHDLVWLSRSMYSSIPTRNRRIRMNSSIYQTLKPGGYYVCQFQRWDRKKGAAFTEGLRKITAWLTLGNIGYQPGDRLWFNNEFVHFFSDESELRNEFKKSGFEILSIKFSGSANGEAILRKSEDDPA